MSIYISIQTIEYHFMTLWTANTFNKLPNKTSKQFRNFRIIYQKWNYGVVAEEEWKLIYKFAKM